MTTLVPDEKRKKWSNKKLEKKGYSCSTFMLYLGVDREYELPHHQIYASSAYEENLRGHHEPPPDVGGPIGVCPKRLHHRRLPRARRPLDHLRPRAGAKPARKHCVG